MDKYCVRCLNKKTAICEACKTVERTDGTVDVPTMYDGIPENIELQTLELSDLSALIERRAVSEYPIPVEWVLRYNKLLGGI